jgi:hypothetical protein
MALSKIYKSDTDSNSDSDSDSDRARMKGRVTREIGGTHHQRRVANKLMNLCESTAVLFHCTAGVRDFVGRLIPHYMVNRRVSPR